MCGVYTAVGISSVPVTYIARNTGVLSSPAYSSTYCLFLINVQVVLAGVVETVLCGLIILKENVLGDVNDKAS